MFCYLFLFSFLLETRSHYIVLTVSETQYGDHADLVIHTDSSTSASQSTSGIKDMHYHAQLFLLFLKKYLVKDH